VGGVGCCGGVVVFFFSLLFVALRGGFCIFFGLWVGALGGWCFGVDVLLLLHGFRTVLYICYHTLSSCFYPSRFNRFSSPLSVRCVCFAVGGFCLCVLRIFCIFGAVVSRDSVESAPNLVSQGF
jgi:hypothetical protein